MKLLEKLTYKSEYFSAIHGRELKKPNEDRFLVDEENGIFILLDGVTRVHNEYENYPYQSSASDISDIFIDEAYNFIMNNMPDNDPATVLRRAVTEANKKVREYRQQKSENEWGFYPAAVGFIGIIHDSTLYYANVGDCIVALIRRGAKILFGREWTVEAVDKKQVTKSERYQIYCNHPENHLSYTVFNGDDNVADGLECSFIDLHADDTVIIATDGIGDYIKYEKSIDLIKQTPMQMILSSNEYDTAPYAKYADDKTLIKLTFQ